VTNWKYVDASHLTVWRINEQGASESCLVSALPQETVIDPPDDPSPAQIQADVVSAVQARLDDFAKTRGYDGILSACTYATSNVTKFQIEGRYCVAARDAHWSKCYDLLTQVQGGAPVPTIDEVIAQMPALEWP
jgi:hypothetical protein